MYSEVGSEKGCDLNREAVLWRFAAESGGRSRSVRVERRRRRENRVEAIDGMVVGRISLCCFVP